jgi:hypothetical protein
LKAGGCSQWNDEILVARAMVTSNGANHCDPASACAGFADSETFTVTIT